MNIPLPVRAPNARKKTRFYTSSRGRTKSPKLDAEPRPRAFDSAQDLADRAGLLFVHGDGSQTAQALLHRNISSGRDSSLPSIYLAAGRAQAAFRARKPSQKR